MHPIDGSRLKISQLQAFVAVADQGNFSLAALQLGLSQSTVSHAIAALEETLEVILLFRGRHGARLTPIGEQMLPDAKQILHLLESMQKKASLEKVFQGGQVRLASVRSIATHILPEAIARFRSQFPLISVVIEECDRYVNVEQALREGRVDIGLMALPTTPDFEAWQLFRDEFVALLPPGMLDPQTALTWEHLANCPMIISHPSYRHNQMINDHIAQFGYSLKFDYEVKEDSTIISMVKQGLGATIMPRLAAEPIPADIQVRSLPASLERVIGAAILAEAILPQAVFVFLDVLKMGWGGSIVPAQLSP